MTENVSSLEKNISGLLDIYASLSNNISPCFIGYNTVIMAMLLEGNISSKEIMVFTTNLAEAEQHIAAMKQVTLYAIDSLLDKYQEDNESDFFDSYRKNVSEYIQKLNISKQSNTEIKVPDKAIENVISFFNKKMKEASNGKTEKDSSGRETRSSSCNRKESKTKKNKEGDGTSKSQLADSSSCTGTCEGSCSNCSDKEKTQEESFSEKNQNTFENN